MTFPALETTGTEVGTQTWIGIAIRAETMDANLELRKVNQRLRNQLEGELLKDNPSEKTVLDLAGQIDEARAKIHANQLKMRLAIREQLTPEQRDKTGRPKLSDLRDSGAIEQDADVVCMLRRPCRYPDDEQAADERLAIIDVAKQRNGPTGEVELDFDQDFTRFRDRAHGVDGVGEEVGAVDVENDMAGVEGA